MRSTAFSISRTPKAAAALALILLGCSGSSLAGQIQSAATTQVQSAMPATMQGPTRPEVQPRLDVDRDPIPSPDAEDNTPASTSSLPASSRPGEIQKLKDGHLYHAPGCG